MRGSRGRPKPPPLVPPPTERKQSEATTYNRERRASQWPILMKSFQEIHKEKCQTVALDSKTRRVIKHFPTGSTYSGDWDVMGMHGYGTYTFPNGVIYEGDFEDGMFHGKGEMQYENGAVLKGKFRKGLMDDKTLLFSDSLEYKEEYWKYCLSPDRRFAIEYDIDLMPAGKSYLTAEQPTKVIPPGYYDCGDGFYDPKTKSVYKYEDLSSITRSPSVREQKWIEDNCRVSPEEPLGPRPDLYEHFTEPVLDPKPPPPPAAGVRSTVTTFRQLSIFEADFDGSDTGINFYDAMKRHSDLDSRPLRRFRLAQE